MRSLEQRVAETLRNAPIAVAVSGGVDSMALALLLRACDAEMVALTVDHGLRPEAASEAKKVAKMLTTLKIPNVILTVKAKAAGNKMEWAREQRYALMADYCKQHKIKTLYVAHHQDDQVETFFLNLERGSGLKGLSGMRKVSRLQGVGIVRPLLEVSKAELAAYVKAKKIKPIEDPTNRDTTYKRNRLRHAIAQVFPETPELPARIGQAMAHLAQAEDFIAEMAEASLEQCVKQNQNKTIEIDAVKFLSLHNLLQYRVLLAALRMISPKTKPPRSDALLGVLERMEKKEKAFTLHGVKGALRSEKWRLSAEEKKLPRP